jgi:8-oxo-dGTP diphosphatase
MADQPFRSTEVSPPERPIPAVIGVVLRQREVLLVRRANPPDAGQWGFPGGKIEAGERLMDAVAREVFEETAVIVEPLEVFTAVDAFDHGTAGELRQHFVLIAVLCKWLRAEPVAGDDALDARWVNLDTLAAQDIAMSFGVGEVARLADGVRHHKTISESRQVPWQRNHQASPADDCDSVGAS